MKYQFLLKSILLIVSLHTMSICAQSEIKRRTFVAAEECGPSSNFEDNERYVFVDSTFEIITHIHYETPLVKKGIPMKFKRIERQLGKFTINKNEVILNIKKIKMITFKNDSIFGLPVDSMVNKKVVLELSTCGFIPALYNPETEEKLVRLDLEFFDFMFVCNGLNTSDSLRIVKSGMKTKIWLKSNGELEWKLCTTRGFGMYPFGGFDIVLQKPNNAILPFHPAGENVIVYENSITKKQKIYYKVTP